jgi:hypothetical protein
LKYLKESELGGSLEIEEPPKTDIYPLTHMQVETTSFDIEPWFSKKLKILEYQTFYPLVLSTKLLILLCFWNDCSQQFSNSDFSQKTGTSSSWFFKI